MLRPPPIALLPLLVMSSGLRLDQAHRSLGRDYPFKLKIRRSEKRTIFALCTLTATSAHKHVQIHQHVYLQRLFVVVLKSLRFEIGRLLAYNMLRQIKHILRNFHVLDLVEVFLLVPNYVGVPQKRAHQTFARRLQADDVLAARQYDSADSNHVHVADSFPDDGESVVTAPSGTPISDGVFR